MDKQKILVVEDDAPIRRILEYQLRKAGYETISADNGESALELARCERPDLILLDVMLPRMDGHEVCRQIRRDYKISQTPVIMLTARGATGDRVTGLEQGANDYITKPYDQSEILVRIRNTLNLTRSQLEANPLTGMPGNPAIEAELGRRIEARRDFAFLYIDIDNFKGFNDTYGYARGDEAIRLLSIILRDAVQSVDPGGGFSGHVGGDDFVVICSEDASEDLANRVIDEFDRRKEELFRAADWKRGFLSVLDRQGVERRIPLMSLTVAVVLNHEQAFKHVGQLSDVAFELKKYGKSFQGSTVVHERRGGLTGQEEDPVSRDGLG